MRSRLRIFTTALLLVLALQLLAGSILASGFEDKLLFYDQQTGEGGVGYLANGGYYQHVSYFGPGAFSLNWTHVTDEGFFYRDQTGDGAKVRVGWDGSVPTLWSRGYFSPWTSITYHEGHLLFYQKANGMAVIGKATDSGFEQIAYYPPGSFGRWSHIISTRHGLFFYDDETGAGAVGRFVTTNVAPPGGFGQLKVTGFTTLTDYGANYFSPGWTSIVDTERGLLFYNKYVGLYALAGVTSIGIVYHVQLFGGVPLLPMGYTSIVSTGDQFLFYNQNTGEAAVGSFYPGQYPFIPAHIWNYIRLTTTYPAGSFKRGWSHITLHNTPRPLH